VDDGEKVGGMRGPRVDGQSAMDLVNDNGQVEPGVQEP